uniref:NAB domain-containing protein n=3 Tax=Daucus carota subsp. sativus TaxID=79200 RepID=A0A166ALV6_DAUCS|nr:PREDICTED: kinase-interacting family protein-like [Daucus carota subsp. sativus]
MDEKCDNNVWKQSNKNSSSSSTCSKPSWLLLSVADLDNRMKMVSSNANKEEAKGDSFAEQAATYYEKRPQLLALLHDLHNGYLTLTDRYCQTLAKHKHRHSSSASSIPSIQLNSDEEIFCGSEVDNEYGESSLSFQAPILTPCKSHQVVMDADLIIADLVNKNVEYEVTVNELDGEENKWKEFSRKIELQKSLLEVLESERLVLLNENARLGYRVGTLVEENKGLSAESLFMKRKAGELARCVLKMRDDYRVCMLSRKIENLQAQIYSLEKRNKEYYEQLVKQEEEKKTKITMKKIMKHNAGEATLEDFFQVEEEEEEEEEADGDPKPRWQRSGGNVRGSGRRVSKIWDRMKNIDMLLCGPHYNASSC